MACIDWRPQTPRRMLGPLLRRGVASVATAGLMLLAFWPGPDLRAQNKAKDKDDEQLSSTLFMSADRKTLQSLRSAQEMLKENRFGEATRLLGAILESSEDYFYAPDRKAADPNGQRVYHSLKHEAQRIVGELPPEGMEAYELQFGAAARKRLDESVEQGDINVLAEVSRRFFHTKAGYEATQLLGLCLMQRGQPLAAAFCFQRLLDSPSSQADRPLISLKLAVALYRAGQTTSAIEHVAKLKKDHAALEFLLGDVSRKLLDNSVQPAVWLAALAGDVEPQGVKSGEEQWLLARGTPDRNGVAAGSTPLLNHRWAVPTVYDPEPRKLELDRLVDQRRQALVDQGEVVLPCSSPLAVNDQVILRTALGLLAIDARTGKRIWFTEDSKVQEQFDKWGQTSEASQVSTLPSWLENRLWHDGIYGTLSSDGQHVFAVEDLSLETAADPQQVVVFQANGRQPNSNAKSKNRLAAYGLARQGALECDSADIKELDGAFFLGPPLPLDGRYYALAEQKQELRLLCLKIVTHRTSQHPRTGVAREHKRFELDWSQQLVMLETPITQDPLRRVAGATPSYADGVLVCPTTAGAVVAVDLTTRALLWGYQYPRPDQQQPRNMIFRFNNAAAQAANADERWLDPTALIAQGHVLVTPAESKKLFCINLADGKLQWEAERDEVKTGTASDHGLFMACVHRNAAVVVGESRLRAFKLGDGAPAWGESLKLPDGVAPSGRGFYNGKLYYLPLSNGEVASIDLDQGKIVARSRTRGEGSLGNLVCYHDSVISQGSTEVESFYQLDVLKRQVDEQLAKGNDKPDPVALALHGELLLNAGQVDEAIAQLRRALADRSDPRARQLLFEALLETWRKDFKLGERLLPELETLIDRPAQRLVVLRQQAQGLHASGDVLGAFRAYLELLNIDGLSDESERIERGWAVRRERWLQARIVDLRQKASADDTKLIEAELRKRLDTVRASQDSADLRAFIGVFGRDPLADEARELLLARGGAVTSRIEEELLLRELEQSSDAARQRRAVAQLVRMLRDAQRVDEALKYVRRMQGDWADLECLDGKTGAQLVREWFGDEAKLTQQASQTTWPTGKIVKEPYRGTNLQGFPNAPIELRERHGSFFDGYAIEMVYQQQSLIGRDGWGRERWRVALAENGNPRGAFFFQPSPNHAKSEGHLLVVAMGFSLLGVDTLGTPGKEGPKVLWRHDLIDAAARDSGSVNWRQVNMPWGAPRIWAFDQQGRPLGSTGPVTAQCVIFQRQRNLVAVHPLTGKTLWVRYGVPQGSELFGDDEYVFVVPPKASTNSGDTDDRAYVFRAADGQELERRAVAPLEQRLFTDGRQVVTWHNDGGKGMVLRRRDLWTQRDLWEQRFDVNSKPWPVGQSGVAVMERRGRFTFWNATDGTAQIDVMLKPEQNLSELVVYSFPDRLVAIVNRPPRGADGFNMHALPQGASGLNAVNGMAYGFDRATGKLVWELAVEKRSIGYAQRENLPVLAFASGQHPQNGNQGQMNLLVVDNRTGRVLADERTPGQIQAFEYTGDPAKHEITLRNSRGGIKLTFTDEPVDDKQEPKK